MYAYKHMYIRTYLCMCVRTVVHFHTTICIVCMYNRHCYSIALQHLLISCSISKYNSQGVHSAAEIKRLTVRHVE